MNKLHVEPHWGAAAVFVAYLYMVWALTMAYPSFKGGGGQGIRVFAVLALPIGAVTLSVARLALSLSFKVVEAPLPRAGVLMLALLVFLAGYGVPNFYVLLLGVAMAVYVYITEKRRQEDEDELADFE